MMRRSMRDQTALLHNFLLPSFDTHTYIYSEKTRRTSSSSCWVTDWLLFPVNCDSVNSVISLSLFSSVTETYYCLLHAGWYTVWLQSNPSSNFFLYLLSVYDDNKISVSSSSFSLCLSAFLLFLFFLPSSSSSSSFWLSFKKSLSLFSLISSFTSFYSLHFLFLYSYFSPSVHFS